MHKHTSVQNNFYLEKINRVGLKILEQNLMFSEGEFYNLAPAGHLL